MTPPERVVLRRLTTDDSPWIAGWFEDPETSRYLGGPRWPDAMLANAEEAVGTMFRGAEQIAADHCLALTGDTPVGYVDGGVFDRCTVYGGEGADGPIILDTIDAVTAAIAFAIDPAYASGPRDRDDPRSSATRTWRASSCSRPGLIRVTTRRVAPWRLRGSDCAHPFRTVRRCSTTSCRASAARTHSSGG